MEPEVSFPYSQEPATGHPEPAASSPHIPTPASISYILILSSHLRLALPSSQFYAIGQEMLIEFLTFSITFGLFSIRHIF
jgi:hypothetical protein